MVTKNNKPIKLYTRTGDGGLSGLADGKRKSKSSIVFEVLGCLDELNSWLGMVVWLAKNDEKSGWVAEELLIIQDRLLVVGAMVAGSMKVNLTEAEIKFLETRIDEYQNMTRDDWYEHFLLPGGVELAARIDVSRSVARRLERVWVVYLETSKLKTENSERISKYINRLSDYLFALRCYINSQAKYEERQFRS